MTAVLISGCSSDEPEATATSIPSPTPTTATNSAAPTSAAPSATPSASGVPETASPTPDAPTQGPIINYENSDGEGVLITRASDTAKLANAPASFKAFIAAELRRSTAAQDPQCPEPPQIYVSKLATDGWASGGYFEPQCGGYAALWASPQGTWKQAWSGQELVDCTTLEKFAFPATISGNTCLAGGNGVSYPRR